MAPVGRTGGRWSTRTWLWWWRIEGGGGGGLSSSVDAILFQRSEWRVGERRAGGGADCGGRIAAHGRMQHAMLRTAGPHEHEVALSRKWAVRSGSQGWWCWRLRWLDGEAGQRERRTVPDGKRCRQNGTP